MSDAARDAAKKIIRITNTLAGPVSLWMNVLLPKTDAALVAETLLTLSARLEAVTAALQLAERECRSNRRTVDWWCVICDQTTRHEDDAIDHAPDCPFAILAAGQTAPAQDPAREGQG